MLLNMLPGGCEVRNDLHPPGFFCMTLFAMNG
jgi:hypothetical protein